MSTTTAAPSMWDRVFATHGVAWSGWNSPQDVTWDLGCPLGEPEFDSAFENLKMKLSPGHLVGEKTQAKVVGEKTQAKCCALS